MREYKIISVGEKHNEWGMYIEETPIIRFSLPINKTPQDFEGDFDAMMCESEKLENFN